VDIEHQPAHHVDIFEKNARKGKSLMTKILVADNNVDAVFILSTILRRAGYSVREAMDGVAALEKAGEGDLDLVLLDIMIPRLNGLSVLKAMKADPNLSRIPVLIISALTDSLWKKQAFDLGAADYLTKPINVKEVLQRVRESLSERTLAGAEQENHSSR
jgi:DNA-binding response OmpR family regulator